MAIRNSIRAISALTMITAFLLLAQFFITNSCVAQQSLSSEDTPNIPVERKYAYRFSKPPTVKHGNIVARITEIGRSEGGMFDGSRFVISISCQGVPKGFSFNEDSVEAVDFQGNELNPWGYAGSYEGGYPIEAELGFELPGKPFAGLREFGGSFDNSYVTQRKYGPYTMEGFEKPLVFKNRRGAISFVDWQVMNIPYEMIADSYVHFTKTGEGTESFFKRLPNEQYGYFVLRFYAIEKDVMDNIEDTKVSVYGSDCRWHDAVPQWNEINSPCVDFTSMSAYLGFSLELDMVSSGKAPAKIVSVNEQGKKAGIEAGDIITKFGSTRVSNFDEATDVMFKDVCPGVPIPITVLRDGREIELAVTPTQYPVWSGMSVDAGTKTARELGKLVGAGRDWRICALAFVSPDPVSLDFKPLKVKLVHPEKVKATKTIPIKFRNVSVPASFWSAKMKERN